MFEFPLRADRIAIGAAVVVAVGISCLGIARVQRFVEPGGDVSYKCSKGAACVEGDSAGKPNGVEGLSTSSNGVFGFTSSTTGSSGVAGESNGKSGTSYGVFGSSSNGPGVYGLEADYYGVEGASTDADGVYGATSASNAAGVEGIANGKSANSYGVHGSAYGTGIYGVGTVTGVSGTATKGDGVYGRSTDSYGVFGITDAQDSAGVFGMDASAYGVYGSGKSAAVFGTTDSGSGTFGESNSGIAVQGLLTSTSGLIFDGEGPGSNPPYCQIDSGANLSCTGEITGKGSQTRHRTTTGRHVLAFASESTSAIIEDFGTSRIVRGTGRVQLEPTFASTIDRNGSYYVFLTPLGDTRGLYVGRKTPSDFEVRETEGGRSSIAFDYRIVAHPADAGNDRLPSAPALRHPRVPRPLAPEPSRS